MSGRLEKEVRDRGAASEDVLRSVRSAVEASERLRPELSAFHERFLALEGELVSEREARIELRTDVDHCVSDLRESVFAERGCRESLQVSVGVSLEELGGRLRDEVGCKLRDEVSRIDDENRKGMREIRDALAQHQRSFDTRLASERESREAGALGAQEAERYLRQELGRALEDATALQAKVHEAAAEQKSVEQVLRAEIARFADRSDDRVAALDTAWRRNLAGVVEESASSCNAVEAQFRALENALQKECVRQADELKACNARTQVDMAAFQDAVASLDKRVDESILQATEARQSDEEARREASKVLQREVRVDLARQLEAQQSLHRSQQGDFEQLGESLRAEVARMTRELSGTVAEVSRSSRDLSGGLAELRSNMEARVTSMALVEQAAREAVRDSCTDQLESLRASFQADLEAHAADRKVIRSELEAAIESVRLRLQAEAAAPMSCPQLCSSGWGSRSSSTLSGGRQSSNLVPPLAQSASAKDLPRAVTMEGPPAREAAGDSRAHPQSWSPAAGQCASLRATVPLGKGLLGNALGTPAPPLGAPSRQVSSMVLR